MPSRQELLAEVLAAPDDDGPRLVYADALMTQGDARGRLVASQIRLGREELSRELALALSAEVRELVREQTARFLVRFRELDAGCVFRRGFVEQLTAPASALTKKRCLGRLMAEEPIRELVLLEVDDQAALRLVTAPFLRQLKSLVCRGSMTGIAARALGRCTALANLTSLDLAGTRLGADGIEAIAQSAVLQPEVVALNGTDARDEGAIALSQGRALASCRRLMLARNRIGRRGGTALARSAILRRIEKLTLHGNPDIGSAAPALEARWRARVQL